MAFRTYNILEAIKSQIEVGAGSLVDSVFVYDGTLAAAIQSHLSQPVTANLARFVFVGLSDHVPTLTSGSGATIRSELVFDIYIVVRASGATRYTTDLARMLDIADCISQEVFCSDCGKMSPTYKSLVYTTRLDSQSRRDVSDGVLSHMLRYRITPNPNG